MNELPTSTEGLVFVPLPGTNGIMLAYNPADKRCSPQMIQALARMAASYLQMSAMPITHNSLRRALRKLNNPQALATSDLAQTLFEHLPPILLRGDLIRRLLLASIERLKPPNDAANSDHRPYLILYKLYVERQPRLQIIEELEFSKRQYARELHKALMQLPEILFTILQEWGYRR